MHRGTHQCLNWSRRIAPALTLSALVCAALLLLPGAGSAELVGAARALHQIQQGSAPPGQTPSADNPAKALEQALGDFTAKKDTLAPEEAARQWLAFYDRFWSLPPERRALDTSRYAMMRSRAGAAQAPLSLRKLIEALPGPAAWEALSKLAADRGSKEKNEASPAVALRLLMELLTGRRDAMLKELDVLKARAEKLGPSEKRMMTEAIRELEPLLAQGDAGNPSVAERYAHLLEFQKKNEAGGVIRVPDLVALAGAAKAEELLRQTLQLPNVLLTIPGGGETLKLAQRLTLELLPALKRPQWGLVASIDDVVFYEALRKKFPLKTQPAGDAAEPSPMGEFAGMLGSSMSMRGYDGSEMNLRPLEGEKGAEFFYLLGLIARGRTQDATSLTQAMIKQEAFESGFREIWDRVDQRPLAPALFAFLNQMLQTRPQLQVWEEYIALALEVGKTDTMLQTIRQAADRKDLAPSVQKEIRQHLVAASLAAGQEDAAVSQLRALLADPPDTSTPKARVASDSLRLEMGLTLARIGKLLGRSDWMDEGLKAAMATQAGINARPESERESYSRFENGNGLIQLLIENGRYEEAETQLLSAIGKQVKILEQTSKTGSPDRYMFHYQLGPQLVQLALVYDKAGRPQDLLYLLEHAPWWGESDLLALLDGRMRDEGGDLGLMAARALAAAGRKDEAVAILKAALCGAPANDGYYQLLTSLAGPELIPWLDQLYARDRFEERPLAWKAVMLQKAGRLEEAEAAAREAIRIDPTDGEQPKGDRLRAYAILAGILEARQKNEEAGQLRNVVKSVRLAEQGDELAAAGLIPRSLKIYEDANALFADAYCIRWRLAEKQYEMGDRAAAERNYQKAFEMMPEQFGRVASLCFGCNQVFTNYRSKSIAEKVLDDLVAKYPGKPQVYYILGQLRTEQNRHQEAYDAFKKALQLDPEYLDAWVHLKRLADNLYLPRAEQDAITLKMLQLDPLQRHSYYNLEEIGDFKGVWQVLTANARYAVETPKTLLPLPASKAWLDEHKKKGNPDEMDDESPWDAMSSDRGRMPNPAELIAENRIVHQIVQLTGQLEGDD